MKKQLLLLTVFFSLLFSNVFSQTVYITKTGKKYHVESCRYLSQSSYSINLSDAIARGYSACSICNPPLQATTPKQATRQSVEPAMRQPDPRKPHLPSPSAVSVQCSAITKAGTRCQRMTKSSNGKCWQHG